MMESCSCLERHICSDAPANKLQQILRRRERLCCDSACTDFRPPSGIGNCSDQFLRVAIDWYFNINLERAWDKLVVMKNFIDRRCLQFNHVHPWAGGMSMVAIKICNSFQIRLHIRTNQSTQEPSTVRRTIRQKNF